MRIPNPFSSLYARATDPSAITTFKTSVSGAAKSEEKKYTAIQASFRGQLFSIVFNDDDQYQVLPLVDKNIVPLVGVKSSTREVTIPPESINFGNLNQKAWKKLPQEMPKEPSDRNNFACSLIEKERNFKAVRFIRWSAHSIRDISSTAYQNTIVKKTALFALGAAILCGAIYYWPKACELTVTQPAIRIIDNTFKSRAMIWLQSWF
ncbi:MAG: hypothetical protein KR126chlam4_01022 [Candidatus Anoxychlamydiales bacterium]|nr:hypothetical protein [Candidatus Anoxychlamydiales bacterium]HEU64976.1 hypothetical protein [Chlamydiota bacterium]